MCEREIGGPKICSKNVNVFFIPLKNGEFFVHLMRHICSQFEYLVPRRQTHKTIKNESGTKKLSGQALIIMLHKLLFLHLLRLHRFVKLCSSEIFSELAGKSFKGFIIGFRCAVLSLIQ